MHHLTRKLTTWRKHLGRRVYKLLKPGLGYAINKETWDSQYESDVWARLQEIDELAHYSVIVGYIQCFKQGGSVLDVGCGQGILQEKLSPYIYSQYVGIDVSGEAIRQASHKVDEKTTFICGDLTTWCPDISFDAIVFNEVLYYFENPTMVMSRYEPYLKEHGIFIISMYLTDETASIWNRLDDKYLLVDETKVTNKLGTSWICSTYLVSHNTLV